MAQLGFYPARGSAIGRGLDADSLIRTFLLTAVFLLLWISLRPFINLAEPQDVTDAGTLANQIVYPAMLVVLLAWCLAHDAYRLKLLLRPAFIVALLWIALSVITSWEPALAARRYLFTLVVLGIAATVPLLPRNTRNFADVLAAVVLFVLIVCYLGVLLLPSLSIHQASDFSEPELAGDWRGVFGHKNGASATMALFIFIGLFVARVRNTLLGGLIIVAAAVFLVFTGSKSAVAMLPLALLLSFILPRIASPAIGIGLTLSGIVVFNILSVGTIFFAPARDFIDWLLPDPTFTGRTEVWELAFRRLAERPITGYGYEAFWSTPEVVYGTGGTAWANVASHAHNGYLDLAVTVGIPGAILVTLWLVILPLVDFYRTPRDPEVMPLTTLFLQVCLFAAYESCFESMLSQEGAHPLFLFVSAFGLRYLSTLRTVT